VLGIVVVLDCLRSNDLVQRQDLTDRVTSRSESLHAFQVEHEDEYEGGNKKRGSL
jgi:hypothetical protein